MIVKMCKVIVNFMSVTLLVKAIGLKIGFSIVPMKQTNYF